MTKMKSDIQAQGVELIDLEIGCGKIYSSEPIYLDIDKSWRKKLPIISFWTQDSDTSDLLILNLNTTKSYSGNVSFY